MIFRAKVSNESTMGSSGDVCAVVGDSEISVLSLIHLRGQPLKPETLRTITQNMASILSGNPSVERASESGVRQNLRRADKGVVIHLQRGEAHNDCSEVLIYPVPACPPDILTIACDTLSEPGVLAGMLKTIKVQRNPAVSPAARPTAPTM